MSKVWFITGCGRGMGTDIAKAALDAGYKVVATGRNTDNVVQAVGPSENLLVVKLDVTNPSDAESAVKAAVDGFGHIDVLVNFYAGFFEEIRPEDFRAQIETNLFGSVNVTRAMLPVMRGQRSGLIVQISSTAGIAGQEFVSAYAASKFAVEGWIESLAPRGLAVRNPHDARGARLFPNRAPHGGVDELSEPTIDDYAEKTRQTVTAWKGMNGLQSGDPAKLAKALVQLASQDEPPFRWPAGADAVHSIERKAKTCWPKPMPTANFPRRSRSMISAAQAVGAKSPSDNLSIIF